MGIWERIKKFISGEDKTLRETFLETLAKDAEQKVAAVNDQITDAVTTAVHKVEEVKEETKRRVKRVKEEVSDVVETVKEVGEQVGDVVDAAKGKPRRGRKPKNKK